MSKLPLISISSRLMLLALVPLVLIELIFSWYHYQSSKETATASLSENGNLIADQLAQASSFYLLSGDYDSINKLLKNSFNRPYIAFISIHNEKGATVAKHSIHNFKTSNIKQYLHFEKVIYNNQIYSPDIFELDDGQEQKKDIGFVHIYLSKIEIEQKTNNALEKAVLYSSVVFVFAFIFIYLFTKRLTSPFYNLLKHFKNAEQGKLGETIEVIENNEIGVLQVGFNSMTQSLLNNRNQLDMDIKNATLKLMNMVSELESKNSQLVTSKNEALKANKVKSKFLANMSHEIRTPINGIKGFIGLLEKSELNDEQRRYAKIIKQSSSDLITIVNEILDFSKVESGKLTLEVQPFDLIDCIETVRDRLLPAAFDKHINIYLSIFSDVPRFVLGDQARLKQILINLISNAVKFTDDGFVQIKVFLSEDEIDETKHSVQFDIIDTGIGISEQDKSKLFNSFQQIESESNRRYSGTGLGLVISRKLAHLMSGNIHLESAIKEGSTFSLNIPFEESKGPEVDQSSNIYDDLFFLISSNSHCLSETQSLFSRAELMTETLLIFNELDCEQAIKTIALSQSSIQYLVIDNRKMEESFISQLIYNFSQSIKIINLDFKQNNIYDNCIFISSTTHSSNLIKIINQAKKDKVDIPDVKAELSNSKKILVVDDNEINLTFAYELLKQWGHEPQKASGALEALNLYQKQPFDIVLMDIQMPEYDGIEAMKMLKNENNNFGIPIIALTANALPEEESRLMNLGFDGYISKPIDETLLSKLINNESISAIKKPTIPKELTSINYEQTLILSGNNKALVKQVFEMLLDEIPQYQHQFIQAKDTNDMVLFKATKHKLEGTTCYASLPKLKNILINATQIKDFNNNITDEILAELSVLKKILRSI